MPVPSGTPRPGGSGLTRSEAAIEAWKHRQRAAPKGGLDPKIATRVKEILAAKQKKGKPKGAKPKAGKAKPTGTKQEIANKNRATVAKQGGMGDLEGALVRVGAGMAKGGNDLEPEAHNKLIDKGLAQRHADGSVTLTGAGKKWKSAADKGDADGANAALSDAKAGASDRAAKEKVKSDKATARETAKADREKTKAAKLTERATKQKKQQQAAKQKAQARKKIAVEKAKARAAKDAAKLAKEKAKATPVEAATAPATPIATGKAIDMSDLAIKAGARHSRTDIQHLQSIHDSSVACGASCATESDDDSDMPIDDEEEGVKAIKSIMDNPLYYAQHECGDIMQAANALSTMAMLIQSELVEEDEDQAHIAMLCDAAHTLVDFIDSELDELEGASKDAAHDAGMGPMKALVESEYQLWYDTTVDDLMSNHGVGDREMAGWLVKRYASPIKGIEAREDVNPKAGAAEYGKVEFADAKNKKYPVDTADHVRSAWNYIAKEANAAKYDPDEVSQIKSKIVSAWKKLIDKAGPPSAGKAWDKLPELFELAGLGSSGGHRASQVDGGAIKSLDNDMIRGYAVRFGDSDHPDLQKDYYTKSTDFWLDHFGWPRPITYHHGMDAGTRNDPVIGQWLKAGIDDVGVWMEGQMDRAHVYYKAMKELAQRGYIRLSSDSAPQWVIREKQENGVNFIKRWPLITSSCTVTPMEPRMLPVEVKAYLAEIGVDIDADTEVNDPDDAKADGQKATDDDRARAILLELELLELELETA